LDETKVQDGEAKSKSQLPMDFEKETLVAESDRANPTSLQKAPPTSYSDTTTVINRLNKSNV